VDEVFAYKTLINVMELCLTYSTFFSFPGEPFFAPFSLSRRKACSSVSERNRGSLRAVMYEAMISLSFLKGKSFLSGLAYQRRVRVEVQRMLIEEGRVPIVIASSLRTTA
jgi:hypothetical protein